MAKAERQQPQEERRPYVLTNGRHSLYANGERRQLQVGDVLHLTDAQAKAMVNKVIPKSVWDAQHNG